MVRQTASAKKAGAGQQAVRTQQPDKASPGETPFEVSAWDSGRFQGDGGVIQDAGGQDAANEGADDQEVVTQDVASGEDLDHIEQDQIQEEEIQEGQILGIEQIKRERDEYLDLARRTQADYENYRKRMMRQQVEASMRSVQELVVRLLPVLDAFSIAQVHLGGDSEIGPDTKALMQSGSMLSDILVSEGLERIDQVGVAFDPFVHDAIEHVASQPGAETVVEVLRAGYSWKGRVLRPAMVRVEG
ncbi:MAG: nucleotide exchange factor GrpE [Acidimicrobiales bacterium]